MTHTRLPRRASTTPSYAVSHPRDPAETQAARAADAVTRGESVRGWSFEQVPARALHRDGPTEDKPPKKGTAGDVVKALAETPVGKQVIEKVKERKDVKAVLDAVDTPGGKLAAVGVGAAALTGLGLAKQPLPAPIPAIPVGTVLGYDASATITITGPVNAPTYVGFTLSFSGSKPAKAKEKPTPVLAPLRSAQDKAAEEQWVRDYVVAQQAQRFPYLFPLRTGDAPKPADAPVVEPAAEEKKEGGAGAARRRPRGRRPRGCG